MFIIRMHPARRFSSRTIAFVFATAALVSQAMAADSGSAIPDMSGQWGRDMLFFEPPPSGPGPIVNSVRKADGTMVPRNACCGIVNPWAGDPANPILKPEAAEALTNGLKLLEGRKIDFAKKVIDKDFSNGLRQIVYYAYVENIGFVYFRVNFKMTSTGWILANFNFKSETIELFPKDFVEP